MAGTAHIYIEGEVGPGWYEEEGNTLKSVRAQFASFDSPDSITVHIDSHGGNVNDGLAIHDFLTTRGLPVTTIGEGRVFSIATIVMLAADKGKRLMSKNASFMIHNPWGGVVGTADEMEEYANEMRKVENRLAEIYVEKTGVALDRVKEWMKKDTYFSAEEAVEMGFADGIYSGEVFAMPRKLKAVARLRVEKPTDKSSIEKFMSTPQEEQKAKGLAAAIMAFLNPKAEQGAESPAQVVEAENPAKDDEKQKEIDDLKAKLEALETEKAKLSETVEASNKQIEASNSLLMQVAAQLAEEQGKPLASTKPEPVHARQQPAPASPFDGLAAIFNARRNG
jgi:ATP-dependent Clp endopeptidase proteolytic subunit ClpP